MLVERLRQNAFKLAFGLVPNFDDHAAAFVARDKTLVEVFNDHALGGAGLLDNVAFLRRY